MSFETQNKILQGNLNAQGLKIAIVASRFNQMIVDKLVDGALHALTQHGAHHEQQTILWVPGAWEIPVAAQRCAKSRQFDAIICVGALIKGSTYHFEYVASEACKGIAAIALETGVPVTMGILTTNSLTQAIERSGATMGNIGYNAAMAAIETTNLLRQIA